MFQQMQYFIAVVDEHNFTRAAEKCNISQSAISQQIKELNMTIGIPLLKRKGRSFELTPAGHYFYRQAKQIIQQVQHTIDSTRAIGKSSDQEYVLRLGYLRMFGTTEFLKTVTEFSEQYPDVKVKITSGTHEQLFKLLREDQLDLNFSDQRRALSGEYHNEFLTETPLLATVANGLFPDDKKQVTTDELANLPCVMVVNPAQLATEEHYCREVLGIKSDFIVASNYDEANILVASRQGFLVTNARSQGKHHSSGIQLLHLYNGDIPLNQKYYAYWKKDNSGYYIETFAQILKKQFGNN